MAAFFLVSQGGNRAGVSLRLTKFDDKRDEGKSGIHYKKITEFWPKKREGIFMSSEK